MDFARARDARDDDEAIERDLDVEVLEIVFAAAGELEKALGRGARRVALARTVKAPERYLPVTEPGVAIRSSARALAHELAAAAARAGSKLHEPIGGFHHFEIVLDDDDRIALVAQALEHADQARGIGRVQADRRFVQNIERSAKPVAELGGEIDALKLAARKRLGQARQREIAHADFVEELHAALDLGENLVGDFAFFGGELDALEPLERIDDRACPRTSEMFLPPTLTARASGLRRAPLQTGQRVWF